MVNVMHVQRTHSVHETENMCESSLLESVMVCCHMYNSVLRTYCGQDYPIRCSIELIDAITGPNTCVHMHINMLASMRTCLRTLVT